MNLDILIKDKQVPDIDWKRDFVINRKVAKLFGANPMLRRFAGDLRILVLWPYAIPMNIIAYVDEMIRGIRKPKNLRFYHDKLVQEGIVNEEDLEETKMFLERLRENSLEISEGAAYDFRVYLKNEEKLYSMAGNSINFPLEGGSC